MAVTLAQNAIREYQANSVWKCTVEETVMPENDVAMTTLGQYVVHESSVLNEESLGTDFLVYCM